MTDGLDDTPQTSGGDTDTNNGNVIQIKEHRGGDTTGGKLTGRQELFCQNVLKGMDQTAAYRAAGYKVDESTDKTVWESASKLFANPKVSARINRGRAQQEQSAVHSGLSLRLKIEQTLVGEIDDPESASTMLRACELLGKSDKVRMFLERTADVTEEMSVEDVERALEDHLKKAFGE
jgi:phage terminase small subunit